MNSSRQVNLTHWQRQQTDEQILRLEALLPSDAPQEAKDRGLKTLRYLNSMECRRYITERNKRALLRKEK
jgi:hypothetical protein